MSDDRLRALAEHLSATAERPVERTASRWLGEAEAVAGDLVASNVDPAVERERLATVAELLENIDGTGDDAADEHVAAARELVDELLAER